MRKVTSSCLSCIILCNGIRRCDKNQFNAWSIHSAVNRSGKVAVNLVSKFRNTLHCDGVSLHAAFTVWVLVDEGRVDLRLCIRYDGRYGPLASRSESGRGTSSAI